MEDRLSLSHTLSRCPCPLLLLLCQGNSVPKYTSAWIGSPRVVGRGIVEKVLAPFTLHRGSRTAILFLQDYLLLFFGLPVTACPLQKSTNWGPER